MWRPSISICICSQRRCRAACVHHWSPDTRAQLRMTIPIIHFKGYPCTDIKVESARHAVPPPSLRWRVCSCLRCGDLLHSNSAATADLLRRVHAPWPVHRPRNPILPRRMWEVMQPGARHHAGNAADACSCRRRMKEAAGSWPPGAGALPRVFADAL